MSFFNVNYSDIIFQLTPHFLRKTNFMLYLFSAIKPLQTLNNDGNLVESFGKLDRINPAETALAYDADNGTYVVGDFVIFENVTYKNNTAIGVPEAFTASKWDAQSPVNISLFQFQRFITNFLNFDARTIYLEKFLNDIYNKVQAVWDDKTTYTIGTEVMYDAQAYIALTASTGKRPDISPADWETSGIEIVNDETIHVLYLFNDAEERDPVYFYNYWDATVSYVTGEFAVFVDAGVTKVFEATGNNTNDQPPSANWDAGTEITYAFNFQDELPFDYRVDIPLPITAQPDYTDERIKSQILLFNAAGRTFEGVEKGNITNQFFNNLN